ncbi:MAG: glycosyl hydrolase family 28-related protein [Nanoarchaeota archaeon]|nr:glycosyl hydrolase family 28-related protein [Nanoarchaeota archaeon]
MKLSKILSLTLLGLTSLVPAKDIYVDQNNHSQNEDGTEIHPYKTIQKAIYNVQSGDIIKISEGVYLEQPELKVNTPFVIRGQGVDRTTIKGLNRNIFTSSVFYGERATSVTLENMTITNAWAGVFFKDCDNMRLEKILSIGNGEINAYIKGSRNTLINNCTMDGTSIYGETQTGVDIEDWGQTLATTTTLTNSIICNHRDIGVELPHDGYGTLVSFNNFYNNSLSTDWRTSPTLINNISADPLFKDKYQGKYELVSDNVTTAGMTLQSISPCIDAGTSDFYHPDYFTDIGAFNKYGRLTSPPLNAVENWGEYK